MTSTKDILEKISHLQNTLINDINQIQESVNSAFKVFDQNQTFDEIQETIMEFKDSLKKRKPPRKT